MNISIFSWLRTSVDNGLATYFSATAAALAGAIAPIVLAGLTIWVLLYGWDTMRGVVQQPLHQFTRKFFGIAIICAIALSAGTYQSFVVDSANGMMDGLVSVLGPKGSTDIYSALDQLLLAIGTACMQLLASGGSLPMLLTVGVGDLIAAVMLLVSGVVLTATIVAFLLMAKIALAVVLALGPMFIACLLFAPTTKYFDGWLSKVLNYVLLIAILAAVAGLMTSIATTAVSAMATTGSGSIGNALGLSIIAVVAVFVSFQAPNMAAGLVGGAPLSGVGSFITGALATGGIRSLGLLGRRGGKPARGGSVARS